MGTGVDRSHARRYQSHQLRVGRLSEPGRSYLVTTTTKQRQPWFEGWNAAWCCARALHDAPSLMPLTSLAWVVMPDHVHWLFTLRDGALDQIMQAFKSRAARSCNATLGRTGPIWQPGYHDHAVREEEDLRRLARYIVGNPIRAGLCDTAGDYPFWDACWL